MNTVVNTLALNLALNNRGIYGATVVDTYNNVYGLDIIFRNPEDKHFWGLAEEVSDEEARELTIRAEAISRKRMAIRATYIK